MLSDEITTAIIGLDRDKVLALVKKRLQDGTEPLEIVKRLQDGMLEVGNLFAAEEYFLSELINCGEIMKAAMVELEPKIVEDTREYRGNIVMATVKGDIHDLGKNIVVMLLKGTGYNVIDLGVDVPAEKIIEAVKEHNAPMLALSVLLTACLESMQTTVQAVKEAIPDVTVIIGGPIINDKALEYCGADYGSVHASEAVNVAKKVFK